MKKTIPIEISARHIHLCQRDLELLFGKGYRLTKKKVLGQPHEFAANETVNIRFRDKEIPRVRIVSPLRPKTQLEVSLTDAYNLEMPPVIRSSGDLEGTSGIALSGPKGQVSLKQGAIVALRHLHASPQDAKNLGIKNNALVSVKTQGSRALTFHNIMVRVKEGYKLSLHLDTDEGNAAGIIKKGFGRLVKEDKSSC